MPTTKSTSVPVRGTIAAATYAAHLTHLSDAELRERWHDQQGTRLNPTAPESLRRQASQTASSLWLLAHARGVRL